VRYPRKFCVFALFVACMSFFWAACYATYLPPSESQARSAQYEQITHNARTLFVYFAWFVGSRSLLFVPRIALAIVQIQPRTHGFCKTYLVHLFLRDGPLYIFALSSLLFWFYIMQLPEQPDKELADDLATAKAYGILTNVISALCLIAAYWHNKLLTDMGIELERVGPPPRGAPPDTISKLETRQYQPEYFGDEEDKRYPSECAICLGVFEPADVIKVTPCEHAFHQGCLASWLTSARTCALCRRDLAAPAEGNDNESEAPPPPPAREDQGRELALTVLSHAE